MPAATGAAITAKGRKSDAQSKEKSESKRISAP